MIKKASHLILPIKGMSCTGCERIIEESLNALAGISHVKADYMKGRVEVSFEEGALSAKQITEAIEGLGYEVIGQSSQEDKIGSGKNNLKESITQLLGIIIIVMALYMLITRMNYLSFLPKINESMGYGVLFIVGFLTSFHCIAMCGGINIAQCASYKIDGEESKLKPSFLYNLGRVIAYTIIGGIVGGVGAVFSFSNTAKSMITLFAGIFMIIMGLNMLNIFPQLRHLTIRMPKFVGNKIRSGKKGRGPLYVGLLNGLMPCGPLQSMQLYALGTGSVLVGALSMFYFSLGTVPLMFGLGALSSLITNKLSHRIMKASAILVMTLGLVMLNRGFSLSGIVLPVLSLSQTGQSADSNKAIIQGDKQVIKTKLDSGYYVPITVQKGIPVKWIIEADESDLNGCNNPIVIPQYNIQKELVVGENVIEFTPLEEGTLRYTCWMGMISSTIHVVEK